MNVSCRAAAWTRSSPSGALTVRPSSVNSTTHSSYAVAWCGHRGEAPDRRFSVWPISTTGRLLDAVQCAAALRPTRECALAGAAAASCAALLLWLGPPGNDLPAHLYQREFF